MELSEQQIRIINIISNLPCSGNVGFSVPKTEDFEKTVANFLEQYSSNIKYHCEKAQATENRFNDLQRDLAAVARIAKQIKAFV